MTTDEINKLIEAAVGALTWMQASHLPGQGDAWGASVKARLEHALYAAKPTDALHNPIVIRNGKRTL